MITLVYILKSFIISLYHLGPWTQQQQAAVRDTALLWKSFQIYIFLDYPTVNHSPLQVTVYNG